MTPELLADQIAVRCAEGRRGGWVVIDPFCGVGGNALAFARAGAARVLASDVCGEKLPIWLTDLAVWS